jgi:4-methyl-5(b-hydroxyethyl)-thiazole monophosphate biosynthesis
LKNKNATTYNQTEYRQILKNNGVVVSNEQIVIDDNLITSNGPSTAVEVAFILLKRLTSKENTLQVRKLMGF